MRYENVLLRGAADIGPGSTVNNVDLGNGVKIAKRCSIFGSAQHILHIGENSYIGMNTLINGFNAPVTIGKNVSIAQNVNIMSDSGPNASEALQQIYPIQAHPVSIGDDCWIGASAIIMPGVKLGNFCVVAAQSFVTDSFEDYSVIGGTPARLLKKLDANALIQDEQHD
ncbi:DapH/DapD/GlmU-related protein [Pseudescherichia sp.]|uniref:acyltransferase n=1 Tax=Pseudescherichia sp. TaxID=2055881 RepID=UPI0028AA754A|nr:DapH/DapD/GlmU-related protein [Pseudescherichia sp.]